MLVVQKFLQLFHQLHMQSNQKFHPLFLTNIQHWYRTREFVHVRFHDIFLFNDVGLKLELFDPLRLKQGNRQNNSMRCPLLHYNDHWMINVKWIYSKVGHSSILKQSRYNLRLRVEFQIYLKGFQNRHFCYLKIDPFLTRRSTILLIHLDSIHKWYNQAKLKVISFVY